MEQKNSEANGMLDLIECVVRDTPDDVNPLALAEDTLAALCTTTSADRLISKALKSRDSAVWRLLRARQCNRQGLNELAGMEIVKALALDDTWYPVHGEHARYLIRKGRRVEAAEAAGRAVELNPTYADGLLMLGSVAFLQRRFGDAVQLFRRIIKLNPDAKEGYYFLGRARLLMGKVTEARSYLRLAQGATAHGYRVLIRLGHLAKKNKDSVGALAAYLDASYVQPNNPFPLMQLSALASQSGLTDKGVEYAKLAVELAPEQQATQVTLAHAYLHVGRADAAITIFHNIVSTHDVADHAVVAELAILLANEKKWDELEKLLAECATDYPHSFELILAKGRMEMGRKAFDDAAASLAAAVQLQPHRLSVNFMLARALFHAERNEEALQVLGQTIELKPNHQGALDMVRKINKRLSFGAAKALSPGAVEILSPAVPVEDVFRFRPEQAAAADHVPVFLQIYNHLQSIFAFVIRETKSRYATQRIGYLSAVLEPMVMMLVLLVIFKYIRHRQPGDMSLEAFLLTGLITLNFVTMSMMALAGLVKRKRTLLLSPQITSFQIRVGEAFIIAVTNVFVAFLLALGFNLFGIEVLIADPPQVVFAIVLAVLMGGALGVIFEGLIALVQFSKVLMAVLSRVLFFTSGVFFSVDDLPDALLQYVLLNPVLHLVEFVRNGFEPNYPMHGVSFIYVSTCTAFLLLLAFLVDKRLRDRVLAR